MRRVKGFVGSRPALGIGGLGVALVVTLLGSAGPVTALGVAPTANPDSATVVAGQAVTVSPLANDTDPEGDQLVVTAANVASGAGTAVVSGNDVVISATAGAPGTIVVDYAITDGTSPASSRITVTVTAPPNNPPIANPDTASMASPGEIRIDPLANDSDPDGDLLAITAIGVQTPSAGTATLAGSQVVVRSVAGYSGTLVIAYTLTDARGAQAAGSITIAVRPVANRAPVARSDRASVVVGGTVRVKVLANDSDPDGDRISLASVGRASKGTASREGSSVRYRAPKSPGSARVGYTIRDARGRTAKGVLTVTVTRRPARPKPPANPPVIKPPAPQPPAGGTATRTDVERALSRLGLPVGVSNGVYDAKTRRAVCAWRTIMGRPAHRGLPSAPEARAIVATGGLPPANGTMVTGVTVSRTCQAAFWVGGDRQYRRVMAASTGKPGYATRLGTHRIFRTTRTWRYSTLYPEARMYKPMSFSGGQALHGSATDALVKTYPASHGCVRMLHRDIDAMQAGGVGNGTLVRVIGNW